MICYECGTKAQRREIRTAKKEMREPQITIKCGSWEKGTCEKCKKKKAYVTPFSDFILVSAWYSMTYGSGGGPRGPKSLVLNDLGLSFLKFNNKKNSRFSARVDGVGTVYASSAQMSHSQSLALSCAMMASFCHWSQTVSNSARAFGSASKTLFNSIWSLIIFHSLRRNPHLCPSLRLRARPRPLPRLSGNHPTTHPWRYQ